MTGVGSRYILGGVRVEYVLDGGARVLLDGQDYPIAQYGDLTRTVSFPPSSQWPRQSNGTGEIHVDLSIYLFENQAHAQAWMNGDTTVVLAEFGPGADWDVFCLAPPGTPPPPPPGGEGCTPGFWKQDQHWDAWTGLNPEDRFNAVFGVSAASRPTLLQALMTKAGGESALLRHAVAALLNARHPGVSYALTADQVTQIVRTAYATGNFEAAKNQLEAQNETICGLN